MIIEPGAVNTTMYDKGETEDLSEFMKTRYWGAIENFRKYVVSGKDAKVYPRSDLPVRCMCSADRGEAEDQICDCAATLEELDIAQAASRPDGR